MGLCSDQNRERGQVLRRPAEFEAILEEEVRGHRTRLSEDVRDERGAMLVMSKLTISAMNSTLIVNSVCLQHDQRPITTGCEGPPRVD